MNWKDLVSSPTTVLGAVGAAAQLIPLIDGCPHWLVLTARIAGALALAVMGHQAADAKDVPQPPSTTTVTAKTDGHGMENPLKP
jgi:hypothetical protein